MKKLNLKTALTAVTLAAATFAAPLSAHASDFNRQCNDTTNSVAGGLICLLYTSPSPRDKRQSRMPSSA